MSHVFIYLCSLLMRIGRTVHGLARPAWCKRINLINGISRRRLHVAPHDKRKPDWYALKVIFWIVFTF